MCKLYSWGKNTCSLLLLIGHSNSIISFFLKTLLVGSSYWEILAHNVQEEEVGTTTGNRKKTQRGVKRLKLKSEYGITYSMGPENVPEKLGHLKVQCQTYN